MAVIAGYGEPVNTTGQGQGVSIKQLFDDLIKNLVQYGVTKFKYDKAIKMAEPACKTDPANCKYYIRQALIAVGLNPDLILGPDYGKKPPQQSQVLYLTDKKDDDDTMKWVLITFGVAAVTGLAVWYFATRS